MSEVMTRADCALILQALAYTRRAFEDYSYPSREVRLQRLADVDHAVVAVRTARDQLKGDKS